MPLLNIFTGKELDDWSGKKTVKTGKQARSVILTTASSVGSDKALPSSPAPGFFTPLSASSKESVASSDSGSSVDASTDDNSTTVVAEGRSFTEHAVVSDSEDGETVEVDDFSLEGYGGGCLDCSEIVVDDPDSDYTEAINYWKRVKANRKRSLSQKRSFHSLSNLESLEEENDETQIEVVHDETIKVQPSEDDEEDIETTKSGPFLRIVKSFSKSQRLARNETNAVDAANNNAGDDGSTNRSENPDARKAHRRKLPNVVKMLSKSKMLSKEDASTDLPLEDLCESSTEEKWDSEDKYKMPDDSDSSGSEEQEEEDNEEGAQEEVPLDECEEQEQELQDLENQHQINESGHTESLPPLGANGRKRNSIWQASIKNGAAATRAMRSRRFLFRIARSMTFNSEDFSEASQVSKSERSKTAASVDAIEDRRGSMIKRASHSVRFGHLGKGIKHSVSRLKKMGKKKSISEPNLVVCIDGKGDRLSPALEGTHTPESSDTRQSEMTDQESQSSGSRRPSTGPANADGSPEVIVQGKGPVGLEMCLMTTNVSLTRPDSALEPFVFDGDTNSVCSSTQNEGQTQTTEHTENTRWFLTHGTGNMISTGSGVEALFEGNTSDIIPAAADSCSVASASESAASGFASESSAGDLNTLMSTSSDDESILYELFPTNSFSSLTGIRCHGCSCRSKARREVQPDPGDLRNGAALVRGRSRNRSDGRYSSTGRAGLNSSFGDSSGSDGFGFNSANQEEALCIHDGGEEDSIIECIAEETEREQERKLSKIREALFR